MVLDLNAKPQELSPDEATSASCASRMGRLEAGHENHTPAPAGDLMEPKLHPNVAAVVSRFSKNIRLWKHSQFGQALLRPAQLVEYLGYDPCRNVKTLLFADGNRSSEERTRRPGLSYVVVCVSIPDRADPSKVAAALNWRDCELASVSELVAVLGYPPGGVSPLGIADVPVLIDASLLRFQSVLVGSGAVALEIEINPRSLVEVTGARTINISLAHRADGDRS